jgi:hypothetical protein
MKNSMNYIFSKLTALVLTAIVSIAIFSSCKEDETGTPKFSTGTPMITKVYLLDTIPKHKDSTIVGAEPYKLIVISGQNIGDVKAAYFNGYLTTFNPTYNTDNNLIITVPGGAPVDSTGIGSAFGKIRLVTSHGETTFNFKLIAKPTVYETDKITFGADRGDITLKGKNFSDVSSVVFSNSTTAVTIVSRTKDKLGNETMTLRFPTSTVGQTTLDITNSSGIITTRNFEFVNADVALKFFTDDFAPNVSNNSWGDPLIINKDVAYAGKASISKKFGKGVWHIAIFNLDGSAKIPYTTDYQYLTFAIKGGLIDQVLWLQSGSSTVGLGQNQKPEKNKITVPAKVWTYYKIALSDLDFWQPGKTLESFGWFLKGPDNDTEVMTFDDVMLVHK